MVTDQIMMYTIQLGYLIGHRPDAQWPNSQLFAEKTSFVLFTCEVPACPVLDSLTLGISTDQTENNKRRKRNNLSCLTGWHSIRINPTCVAASQSCIIYWFEQWSSSSLDYSLMSCPCVSGCCDKYLWFSRKYRRTFESLLARKYQL